MNVQSSVERYFSIVKNYPQSYVHRIEDNSSLCHGVLCMVHGTLPVDEFINSLIKKRGYQLPTLNLGVCKSIISNCVVQPFSDSDFATQNGDIPLMGISSLISNN